MESHHKQRKDVRDRLSRIEGHVRGIIKMIDDDRTCPDLLIQIAAVRAALNKAGQVILEDHVESCIGDAVASGEVEPHLVELRDALSKFF